MKLTENTMSVLKNFASIQRNIVLCEGDVVKTIAETKNVMAVAKLDQSFDKQVGLYDLEEFLNLIGLVDTCDLEWREEFVKLSDASGRSSVKYFYSDPDILTAPPKDINIPECEVKFELDDSTLSRIRRAASALGHEKVSITAVDGGVQLCVLDPSDDTSNAFFIVVPGSYDQDQFNFVMNISNLKLLSGDYDVEISSRLISKFTNKNVDVKYYIALEKSSTYGAS